VTKLKEILLIAEVNGDGGNTPGYNSTSTEDFTEVYYFFISILICVVLSGLGFLVISKQIF
jgi:hypothetical protein